MLTCMYLLVISQQQHNTHKEKALAILHDTYAQCCYAVIVSDNQWPSGLEPTSVHSRKLFFIIHPSDTTLPTVSISTADSYSQYEWETKKINAKSFRQITRMHTGHHTIIPLFSCSGAALNCPVIVNEEHFISYHQIVIFFLKWLFH